MTTDQTRPIMTKKETEFETDRVSGVNERNGTGPSHLKGVLPLVFFSGFYLDAGGGIQNFGPHPNYDIYVGIMQA